MLCYLVGFREESMPLRKKERKENRFYVIIKFVQSRNKSLFILIIFLDCRTIVNMLLSQSS